MTDQRNICYCGEYGGGVHTRSARCPGGELRTLEGEPALTQSSGLPGTREPVVIAPQGNAGESPPRLLSSNKRLYAKRDHYALSPHFERHMLALTSEELQSKSAIAAELAHRDAEIERLTLEFRLSSQQAAALRDERERLRAALLYWRNECSGREPSLSVFERMIDRSLSGDSSTSSDGSGRPTVPNDAVNATTSTGPGPSDETSCELERLRELQEKALALDDAVAEFGIDKPQYIAEVYQAFHDALHDGHGCPSVVETSKE